MQKTLLTQDGCRIINMDHFVTAGIAETVGGANYKQYGVFVTLDILGVGGNSNQQISKPIEIQVSVHDTIEECKEDIKKITTLMVPNTTKYDREYCDLSK